MPGFLSGIHVVATRVNLRTTTVKAIYGRGIK
jgi:hypothetical protein